LKKFKKGLIYKYTKNIQQGMARMIQLDELIKILKMSTMELYNELKKNEYAIAGKHYLLWFKGEGLPCLVSHIDHVYQEDDEWLNRDIFVNEERIWSPLGVAGDDRCGVYACIKLFDIINVNVLFCDGEERGGIGASEACNEKRLKKTPYFIEIDRKNYKEAVFYNNDEEVPEWVDVIRKYFNITSGTFSDISILGQHFGVCSVNLSAGFYEPHKKSAEYIHLPSLEYTIEKIPVLISEFGNRKYELKTLHR
jgi:hypothetical protein